MKKMMNTGIDSGITTRENQIKDWLRKKKFHGEYVLISTKPNSVHTRKLYGLSSETKLIVDLYTPIFLEKALTLSIWRPRDWVTRGRNRGMIKRFLARGNHFLVANRRQKQYWIEISRKLGVSIDLDDISVFPTGSGDKLPITNYQLPITDRRVVLWFGGVYPWMDPKPLIESFGRLAPKFPDWKLRFLGGWQPGTGYKQIYKKLERLCRGKIPNNQLEFVPWQPEKKLGKYFSDVAFAVHLVRQTAEDYYAHRVRLLTLAHAQIGVLTSGNDVISNIVVRTKAGLRVQSLMDDIEKTMAHVMRKPKWREQWSVNAHMIERMYIGEEVSIQLDISRL